jgi:hypothetical protein
VGIGEQQSSKEHGRSLLDTASGLRVRNMERRFGVVVATALLEGGTVTHCN